ncbi:hypothetical protein GCM10011324_15320 [Allosediminivita pacifica]|nr:hypothetical protein GCM10011324_15320 [Allosediminivita pacifica]
MMSLYYFCEASAAERMLPLDEAMACAQLYDSIKIAFLDEPAAPTGTPERIAQNRLGYRGFKAWEAAHPDLVATLRASARRQLGH